jgi:hypothetical protein
MKKWYISTIMIRTGAWFSMGFWYFGYFSRTKPAAP